MRLQIGKEHRQTAETLPLPASCIVLFEVAAASLFVVGLFDAASQPLSWPSAVQFLLCGSLGPALWLADRQLQHVAAAAVATDPAKAGAARRGVGLSRPTV